MNHVCVWFLPVTVFVLRFPTNKIWGQALYIQPSVSHTIETTNIVGLARAWPRLDLTPAQLLSLQSSNLGPWVSWVLHSFIFLRREERDVLFKASEVDYVYLSLSGGQQGEHSQNINISWKSHLSSLSNSKLIIIKMLLRCYLDISTF